MKNIYQKDFNLNTPSLIIEGDSFHHFKNVVRGKKDDEVKIFDGRGHIARGIVTDLRKKEMEVKIESVEYQESYDGPTLILGIPKKEYLESILRSAIQIGVSKIKLVITDFTPWKYKYYDRLEKIMEAALIQSENPYFPQLELFNSLSEVINQVTGSVLAFSTEIEARSSDTLTTIENLLVGPEGGFSQEEIDILKGADHVTLLRCDIPIMKAEVAVPFGLG